jgi:hypothetical protein
VWRPRTDWTGELEYRPTLELFEGNIIHGPGDTMTREQIQSMEIKMVPCYTVK